MFELPQTVPSIFGLHASRVLDFLSISATVLLEAKASSHQSR